MNVPMLNLPAQHAPFQAELEAAVQAVLRGGQFILGKEVAAAEEEIAAYCGARYGIGVASGTDALVLSLRALGIGRGDEVITSTFTYVATAQAITSAGAKPVFVDIDPLTYNLDPAQVEAAITPRTAAFIPVHLFGQCADMEPLLALAQTHGLAVIEDAAQAIGARYRGRGAGTMGQTGCLSFYPTKNLGGAGDGGMILTNDPALAEKLRLLRLHGRTGDYYYELDGHNSRLDEIQAAILRVKLKRLATWTAQRQRHAALYDELLADLPEVHTPPVAPGNEHVYHLYSIRAEGRDVLREWLRERGIATAVYYPLPLHLQPIYESLGQPPGSLPVAEAVCRDIVSLPVAPELGEESIRTVAAAVREFYHRP
ncbi:MAG TPA: DegT/DnrJ/EryC1/StrS family aminotransferase [Armatimonadetes bacterium]|nr:DegT/DnrJ/EryC1/StrS family aminotransferase [Armatimonadota bacterium]